MSEAIELVEIPEWLAASVAEDPESFREDVAIGSMVIGLAGSGRGRVSKVRLAANPKIRRLTIGDSGFGRWDDVSAWLPVPPAVVAKMSTVGLVAVEEWLAEVTP